MTTFTELLEPTKSEKHGCLFWMPAISDFGIKTGTLTIAGSRAFAVYDVEEFPADHGRGFMLFKKTPGTDITEDRYACFVGSDDVGHCECKGFASGGRCKHLQSLYELVKAKQI